MERVENIHCVLDACTAINLIHIDQDEFLLKRLAKLQTNITDKVQTEIRKNIFKKYEDHKFKSASEKRKKINELDKKVSFFLQFKISDETIKKDIGDENFFEDVKTITKYKKENGEFFSAALCLFLSRLKHLKVFFHTDDFPATNEFSNFFRFHQIGRIEDSVDLLILLYVHSDSTNFTKNKLTSLLTELFQEYATQVKKFEKELEKFIGEIPAKKIPKMYNLKFNLDGLLKNVRELNFNGINAIRLELEREKLEELNGIFNKYETVFELENGESSNILMKIKSIQNKLKKEDVYTVF